MSELLKQSQLIEAENNENEEGDSSAESLSATEGEPADINDIHVVQLEKKPNKKSIKKIGWEIVWHDSFKDCTCIKTYKTLKDVNKDHPKLTRSRCHYMGAKSKSHIPNRKELKYIKSIKKIEL